MEGREDFSDALRDCIIQCKCLGEGKSMGMDFPDVLHDCIPKHTLFKGREFDGHRFSRCLRCYLYTLHRGVMLQFCIKVT